VKKYALWLLLSVIVLVGGWFGWRAIIPLESPRGRQNYVTSEEIDY